MFTLHAEVVRRIFLVEYSSTFLQNSMTVEGGMQRSEQRECAASMGMSSQHVLYFVATLPHMYNCFFTHYVVFLGSNEALWHHTCHTLQGWLGH